jgi:ppGpp synthetase/RelA/SpoT-type nucleotidyltranferase
MRRAKITATESKLLDRIVEKYNEKDTQYRLDTTRANLVSVLASPGLSPHTHSIKSRLKDPEHLLEKLNRKLIVCKETKSKFPHSPDNFLTTINDLVGIRILHLHTRQFESIDAELRKVLVNERYELLEGPVARTWDDENREYFENCGIECITSKELYTSVHYVVGSYSAATVTAEIQVRTLSDEVWGEVSHMINYPKQTDSLACREQLKVLARATSTATRLVDSIFATYDEYTNSRT